MNETSVTAIDRTPLHSQVGRILMDRILSGQLPPRATINETQLAAELGVSRTPLREALARLERDGLLEVDHRGRAAVPSLSVTEVRELYPILAALEALALRTSEPLSDSQVAALKQTNEQMSSGGSTETVLRLNEEWHRTLLAGCANRRLMEMISSLRRKVYRYEYAYFTPEDRVAAATGMHNEILSAVLATDREAASEHLGRHCLSDLDALVPAVAARVGGE